MKGYVCILLKVICDEIMESCLIYYHEKYGDLMHYCMFTCIEILPLYDEYGCVHCEIEMAIMFSMVQRRSLFPSSVRLQFRGASPTSKPKGCASPPCRRMLACVCRVQRSSTQDYPRMCRGGPMLTYGSDSISVGNKGHYTPTHMSTHERCGSNYL